MKNILQMHQCIDLRLHADKYFTHWKAFNVSKMNYAPPQKIIKQGEDFLKTECKIEALLPLHGI